MTRKRTSKAVGVELPAPDEASQVEIVADEGQTSPAEVQDIVAPSEPPDEKVYVSVTVLHKDLQDKDTGKIYRRGTVHPRVELSDQISSWLNAGWMSKA